MRRPHKSQESHWEERRQYQLHPAALVYMIEFLDINSLDDFRLNYETNHTSKDFQDLIINAQRYTQAKIVYPVKEAVRLARAWQDADSCHKKATKHKEAPPENADEDDPLTGTELKGHKKKLLARYSTDFFLDELTPSDKTVSRLYRECRRRTLEFPNLSKVTSISEGKNFVFFAPSCISFFTIGEILGGGSLVRYQGQVHS